MSGHGYANGNLEYSSIAVKMYLFPDYVSRGPLKSMLIRSIGFVALISPVVCCLKKLGFNSAQILHFEQTSLISSSEYGKFFCLT